MFRVEFQPITLTPLPTNMKAPIHGDFRVSINNPSSYSYKHVIETSSRLPKILNTSWKQTIVYEYKLNRASKIATPRIEINHSLSISHSRLPFVI